MSKLVEENVRDILTQLVLGIGEQVTRDYEAKNGIYEGMSINNKKSLDGAVEYIMALVGEDVEDEQTAFNRGLIWATEYLTNRDIES